MRSALHTGIHVVTVASMRCGYRRAHVVHFLQWYVFSYSFLNRESHQGHDVHTGNGGSHTPAVTIKTHLVQQVC